MLEYKIMTKDGKFQLEVCKDENPENPRDWDNLGTMVCIHKRYDIPCEITIDFSLFDCWEAIQAYLEEEHDACIVLPIYMIDHGFACIATTPFSNPFDSGQIGFIFVSKKTLDKEYPDLFNLEASTKAKACMVSEVETYNDYLINNIWQYEIRQFDKCEYCGTVLEEVIESSNGYYGDEGIKDMISDISNEELKEELKRRSIR